MAGSDLRLVTPSLHESATRPDGKATKTATAIDEISRFFHGSVAKESAGCERIFWEKASGGRWDRPDLIRLEAS